MQELGGPVGGSDQSSAPGMPAQGAQGGPVPVLCIRAERPAGPAGAPESPVGASGTLGSLTLTPGVAQQRPWKFLQGKRRLVGSRQGLGNQGQRPRVWADDERREMLFHQKQHDGR